MNLNPEQQQAAHYSGSAKHILVLAGAGTGKTRTIIARILYLIRQGVPAERLLMLTFTRRASKEMLLRLNSEVGKVSEKITAGTFHHFCLQVMRRVPKAFNVQDRTVIDRDDAQSLLQMIRGETLKKGEKRDFPKAASLLNYVSYAKNCCLTLEDYLTQFTDLDENTQARCIEIGNIYESRKQQRHYLDYDDILHLFVKGIEGNPELRKKIAGSISTYWWMKCKTPTHCNGVFLMRSLARTCSVWATMHNPSMPFAEPIFAMCTNLKIA